MAALRWWVEKSDGSGYLLPVGADNSINAVYNKSASTPYWEGANPPLEFRFMGVASNQNASPTVAQVNDAIDAFFTFATTNDTISYIKLLEYDGAADEAMGAALGSVPGTTSETYEPSYAASGFEITDFNTSDRVSLYNFAFELRITNLYISTPGGSSPADIGDLSSANVVQSRTVANGIETNVASIDATLQSRSQLSFFVNAVIGAAVAPEQPTFIDELSGGSIGNGAKVPFGGIMRSGEADSLQFSFDPVTMNFSGNCTASRPVQGMRSDDHTETRAMNISGSLEHDLGITRSRLKTRKGKAGNIYQRGYNPEVVLEVAMQFVNFKLSGDFDGWNYKSKIANLVQLILDSMELGPFVLMSEHYGRGTGGISVVGSETSNTWNVRFTLVGSQVDVVDPGASQVQGQDDSIKAKALLVLDQITLKTMLTGGFGAQSEYAEGFNLDIIADGSA